MLRQTQHDTQTLCHPEPRRRVINPIEKWIETLEDNKKLYERLLQSEKDKVALLEKILDKK